MPEATQLTATKRKPNGIDALAKLVARHGLAAAVIRVKLLEKVTKRPTGYWSNRPQSAQGRANELGDIEAILSGPYGIAGETQKTDSRTSTFHWDEALPSGLALNVLRAIPNGKQNRTVYVSTQQFDPVIIDDQMSPEQLEKMLKRYMDPHEIVAIDQELGDGILFHREHYHLYRDNGIWTRFAPPGGPHQVLEPSTQSFNLLM